MPHILRDVNPIVATLLTQHNIFYDRAIIIVSSHSNLASQDNKRLILRWMFMDGNHSPWLHCIQEPMALILQRLMKIKVVLIFTAVKKLKPCGSHSSPIFHTNFRSY